VENPTNMINQGWMAVNVLFCATVQQSRHLRERSAMAPETEGCSSYTVARGGTVGCIDLDFSGITSHHDGWCVNK